jgi:hypothetical protein
MPGKEGTYFLHGVFLYVRGGNLSVKKRLHTMCDSPRSGSYLLKFGCFVAPQILHV